MDVPLSLRRYVHLYTIKTVHKLRFSSALVQTSNIFKNSTFLNNFTIICILYFIQCLINLYLICHTTNVEILLCLKKKKNTIDYRMSDKNNLYFQLIYFIIVINCEL